MALATEAPGQAHEVIASIREKLDALELLLDGEGATGRQDASVGEVNGSAGGRPPGLEILRVEIDDVGRNQRSRIREMTILEILSSESRPFSLQQIMRALEGDGFADGGAAVVSQLHRMKKVGIIEQPANGMYEITQDGLGHLRKLKGSFGALVRG